MNQTMPKPAFGEPSAPAERVVALPPELGAGYGSCPLPQGDPYVATAAQIYPAPAVPAAPAMSTSEMISAYRRVRERKEQIQARHDEELKPYKDMLRTLDIAILEALNAQGANSIRGDDGVAFKVSRTSYSVSDPKELREYVESTGNVDLLETRVSKSALEEHLKNGGALPPGIKVSSDVTINVRKGK